jgi:MFS family permease
MALSPMTVLDLLRGNADYRRLWTGQVVSDIGGYFNTVAVLALIMEKSGSGLVVSLMFLSRAIPSVLAAPFAGVLLDRLERRHVMIAADLFRAAVAILFLFTVDQQRPWLLYALSGLLAFASPFFTAGRAAILPSIATPEQLHAANSMTQTTGWATQSAGAILGGWCVARLGYPGAFLLNAAAFVFSAWRVGRISAPRRPVAVAGKARRGVEEYVDGLRYIRSVPLTAGIGMISVGWAIGGGAAQILFALFGEQVFHRGAEGIGSIWGFAGIGLLIGGAAGHWVGRRATFASYKRTVAISYIAHGAGYMLFSQAGSFGAALALILFSRVGMSVSSVLNTTQLLRHTPDEYLGRVFATLESLRNAVMIFSMTATGVASQHVGPRSIGLVAGGFGMLTAIVWAWADWSGRLPEPAQVAPAASR